MRGSKSSLRQRKMKRIYAEQRINPLSEQVKKVLAGANQGLIVMVRG